MNHLKIQKKLFNKNLLCIFTLLMLMLFTIKIVNAAKNKRALSQLKISKINFNGLTKTSESWLLYFTHAKNYIGKEITSFNEDKIRQRLLSTNLFSNISFKKKYSSTGVIVTICLKEKASLIPLPMISGNGDSVNCGIFLAEMNFLEKGKTIFIGANYSKKGLQANVGYLDNAFISTKMSFSISIEVANTFIKDRDNKNKIYSEYLSDRVNPYYSLGYKLHSDLELIYFGEFKDFSVKVDPNNFNIPKAAKFFFQGLKLEYKNLTYKDYFNYGLDTSLEYRHGFSATSEFNDTDIFKLSIKQTFLLWSKHQLRFGFNAGYGNRPTIIEERLGGQYGFRTLTMDEVTADDYYSFIFEYEFPVISFSWSTITLITFYEAGQLHRRGIYWQTFHGPGSGFRFYLNDVSIPAIGFDLAWNFKTKKTEFSFSIGIKM